MAAFPHPIDPSRFVTQVSNRIQNISNGRQGGSQFMDFVSVNMYDSFASSADHAHAMYPNAPIFVSEYSPDGCTFGTNREGLDFTTGTSIRCPSMAWSGTVTTFAGGRAPGTPTGGGFGNRGDDVHLGWDAAVIGAGGSRIPCASRQHRPIA